VIEKYIEIGLNKNIELIQYTKSLAILLNYKSDDLNLISKIISIYLKNVLCKNDSSDHISVLLFYCDYWIKLNFNDIKCSNNKIQFIFMRISIFINHHIHIYKLYDFDSQNSYDQIESMNFEKYNQIVNMMKCIFDLLSNFYDQKTFSSRELLDLGENYNMEKISQSNKNVEKPKVKTMLKNKSIIELDCSDIENKYDDYSDSDNSATVYKKAISNTTKRAKKIIKKGSEI
jgi:hypothetical protein